MTPDQGPAVHVPGVRMNRRSPVLLSGGSAQESPHPETDRRTGTQPRPHDGRPLADRAARLARVVGQDHRSQRADRTGAARSAGSLRARGRPRRTAVSGGAGAPSRTRSQGLLHSPRPAVRPSSTKGVRFGPGDRRRARSAVVAGAPRGAGPVPPAAGARCCAGRRATAPRPVPQVSHRCRVVAFTARAPGPIWAGELAR